MLVLGTQIHLVTFVNCYTESMIIEKQLPKGNSLIVQKPKQQHFAIGLLLLWLLIALSAYFKLLK